MSQKNYYKNEYRMGIISSIILVIICLGFIIASGSFLAWIGLFFCSLSGLAQYIKLKELKALSPTPKLKESSVKDTSNKNENVIKIEKPYFAIGIVIIVISIYLFVISLDWSWTYSSQWLWYGKHGLGHWYEINDDESWMKFLYYPFVVGIFVLGFWFCKNSITRQSNNKEKKESNIDHI